MDPITIGNAILNGSGGQASSFAYILGNSATGMISGPDGVHQFSVLKDGLLDSKLSLAGKIYSLRPDLISSVPFGQSFTVLDGIQSLGHIGSSSITGNVMAGPGLGTQLGTQMGSALTAAGVLQ